MDRLIEDGAYPFMVPVLRNFVLSHAHAHRLPGGLGELAIGTALVLGRLVRPASLSGLVYMAGWLFSSNSGPRAALWQYFGASLNHLVLALCFTAFAITKIEGR